VAKSGNALWRFPGISAYVKQQSVECATLDWVDWFNNRRLLEPIGYIPPAEFEQLYYDAEAGPILGVGLK
jgi:putative transposase